jgi:hypothetical protein
MRNVKLIGKNTKKCECCGKYGYNTYFYKWYSLVTKDYLCTICFKCARRELFGSKYKYNKRYEVWLEETKQQ